MAEPLRSFVCFDFETTGWTPESRSLPWQIGIARFSGPGFQEVRLFEALLRVPADQEFNQYTPGRWAKIREELADSRVLTEYWPQIHAFLSSSQAAVAHHIATERGILDDYFPCQHSNPPWIDTVNIAKVAFPRQQNYKLENLLPDLSLTPQAEALCPGRQPHDALYDAVACGVLLRHILAYPPWNTASAETLSQL